MPSLIKIISNAYSVVLYEKENMFQFFVMQDFSCIACKKRRYKN